MIEFINNSVGAVRSRSESVSDQSIEIEIPQSLWSKKRLQRMEQAKGLEKRLDIYASFSESTHYQTPTQDIFQIMGIYLVGILFTQKSCYSRTSSKLRLCDFARVKGTHFEEYWKFHKVKELKRNHHSFMAKY